MLASLGSKGPTTWLLSWLAVPGTGLNPERSFGSSPWYHWYSILSKYSGWEISTAMLSRSCLPPFGSRVTSCGCFVR